MTPEQIRSSIESIVSKNQIFAETLKDGFVDDIDQEKINMALEDIKKEIGGLTQHPDELKLFNDELRKQVEEKGLFTKKVENTSTQETDTLKTQIENNTFTNFEKTTQRQIELSSLLSQISGIKSELTDAKFGRGKEVRKTVRYIKEWFDRLEFNIQEVQSGKYTNIKEEHITGLIAKTHILLKNVTDYKSQLVTGDLDEAKKYFPPNIFNDAGYYIPDVKKGDFDTKKGIVANKKEVTPVVCDNTNSVIEHNGTFGEQFAENGALGALNAGLEKAGAGSEMRSRAYKVGNLVRSAAKVTGTIWAGWNFLKSARKTISGTKKEGGGSYFGDMAKYGTILAGGYVLGPSIDKLVRGGDTSRQAAELFGTSVGKTPTDIKEHKQDAEIKIDGEISAGLFKDIPWKDWSQFTTEKGDIDFEKLKGYLLQKEGVEGIKYKALQEIEQSNSLSRIQNFLTDMGINGLYIIQKIKNNPDETITKTYEEAKRRGDIVAETYTRDDSAKVRPMIETIDAEMAKSNDPLYTSFKEKKMDIEKELNILYIKHENARPIKITYNTTSQQIEIESYQQKSILESGNTPGIKTIYTAESRKTADHNEAIRINNLVNFLTAPQIQLTGRSKVDKPFHESTIKGDIEFEKANRRESFKQLNRDGNLKDISVLNDSFRSPRFKELYPSIANNKKEFINWLNNFKKNGKSVWKK